MLRACVTTHYFLDRSVHSVSKEVSFPTDNDNNTSPRVRWRGWCLWQQWTTLRRTISRYEVSSTSVSKCSRSRNCGRFFKFRKSRSWEHHDSIDATSYPYHTMWIAGTRYVVGRMQYLHMQPYILPGVEWRRRRQQLLLLLLQRWWWWRRGR